MQVKTVIKVTKIKSIIWGKTRPSSASKLRMSCRLIWDPTCVNSTPDKALITPPSHPWFPKRQTREECRGTSRSKGSSNRIRLSMQSNNKWFKISWMVSSLAKISQPTLLNRKLSEASSIELSSGQTPPSHSRSYPPLRKLAPPVVAQLVCGNNRVKFNPVCPWWIKTKSVTQQSMSTSATTRRNSALPTQEFIGTLQCSTVVH